MLKPASRARRSYCAAAASATASNSRATATITHPNLCPLYDVGEINGRIFLNAAGPNVIGGPGTAGNIVAGNRNGQIVTAGTAAAGVTALRATVRAARRS